MAEFVIFGIDFGWDVFLANSVGVMLALWLAKRVTSKFDEQAVTLSTMNETPMIVENAKAIASAMDNGHTEAMYKRLEEYDALLNRAQEANNSGMTGYLQQFPRVAKSVDEIELTLADQKVMLAQQNNTLLRVGEAYGELAKDFEIIKSVEAVADTAVESAANNSVQLKDIAKDIHSFESQIANGMTALKATLNTINQKVDRIQEDI